MMTAEQLKNSILQLAMQGKLVEQRLDEGTGEELYKEIQVEKKRLIKEKRYKAPKPQEDLVESELPFDIPDNWRWCQVGDFFSNASGLSYKKGMLSEKSAEMVRILRGGNIGTEEYFFREDDQFIKKEYVDDALYLKKGYMITPAVTSLNHIGKIGLIDQDYTDVVAGGFVLMLMPYFDNGTISRFLLYWFDTKEHRDACRGITHKSGQAFYNLSREKLMNLPVPLPPLAEQKRIVAKIEELMPIVEQYAAASTKLNTLNASFPEMMKKSILQEAVQGKLVPQDPNDEPASLLLKKIAEEKKRLIKEGKIKKQKLLPEITEDEIPFDIPESWEWIRIGMVTDVKGGKRVPKGKSVIDSFTPHIYIRVTDMKNQTIVSDKLKYITEDVYQEIKQYTINKEDLYLTIAGTIGAVGVVPDMFDGMNLTENAVKLCNILIYKDYLLRVIQSPLVQAQFVDRTNKVAQPKLAIVRIESTLIPLPPLEEQKRIVEMLDKLMLFIDGLDG